MASMPPARRLVPGHIHQAMRLGGMQIAIIWPSTRPGRWHVGLTTSVRWASHDPVAENRVFDLLRTWGFDVDDCETWRHWAWTGPLPDRNPQRGAMERDRALDRHLGEEVESPLRLWLALGRRRLPPDR
jgi:hypothetical protein